MLKSNFMEKLLDGVKVEWKSVEEIFNLRNGYTPSKTKIEYWENGTVPWFRMEDIRNNGKILSDSIQHITISAVKGELFPANSIIMSTTATLGEHALIRVPFLTNQQITNFSVNDSYKDKVDIKFLFYCFFDFGKWVVKNANKNGSVGIISIQKLKQYIIPIPPIHIQKEIVNILDLFTELTEDINEKLIKEIAARRKQYKYYREKLLTFELEKIEWRHLGEISEYSKKRIGSTMLNKTNYIGVDNLLQDRNGKFDSKYVPTEGNFTKFFPKDILIGNIRPYLKKIWYSNCVGGTNGDVLVIHTISEKINSKFLFQVLSDDRFFDYNMQNSKGTKMPRGNKDKIMQYIIPIPPLEEQERIVSILDKFDDLVNSIIEALAQEIEFRQKEYEYYRERLLRFPKKEVNI